MTTVADIERLRALVDRLLPLSSRARGEVISADDWNTLVGTLLEVARAVVDDGTDTSVPPHEHLDQVTLAWLEPRLRTLIERGPLADPGAVSRVSAVERSAALSLQQVDQLSAQVRDLRVSTSRQETNDLDRASSLTTLSRKVEGLTDPRDEISTLRNSLDAIGTNVAAVSTFAAGLGDVTPRALLDGLTKVDALQQRLTTATGALLDATEFERRMTELRTTLVTEDELTAAIGAKRAELPDTVRATLLEEARAAAQRQADDSAAIRTEQLRAQLNDRIGDVEQSVVLAARDAAGQFRDELRTAITAELTAVIERGDAAVADNLRVSLAETGTALQETVDSRVGLLEASLTDRVASAVADARPELLAAFEATIEGRLADVAGQFTELQSQVRDVRATLVGTATDVAALRASTAAALERQADLLRTETARLSTALAEVRSAQTSGLESLRAELAVERGRVNTALEDVRRQIPPIVRGVTVDELNTAIAANNDRLRSAIVSDVTRDIDVRIDGRLAGGTGGVFQPIIRDRPLG